MQSTPLARAAWGRKDRESRWWLTRQRRRRRQRQRQRHPQRPGASHLDQLVSHGRRYAHAAAETLPGLRKPALPQKLPSLLEAGRPAPAEGGGDAGGQRAALSVGKQRNLGSSEGPSGARRFKCGRLFRRDTHSFRAFSTSCFEGRWRPSNTRMGFTLKFRSMSTNLMQYHTYLGKIAELVLDTHST